MRLVRRLVSTFGLCLGVFVVTAQADAATDQAQFTVSATVIASCDVTAQNLSFNNYDPVIATPTDATTTLSVFCTNGTTYTVALDAGTGSGATVTTRKMTSGANTLSYSLYKDSGYATVWGASGGALVSGTGSGAAQSLTVYGRIAAQQTSIAGSYTDTVTVTVTY